MLRKIAHYGLRAFMLYIIFTFGYVAGSEATTNPMFALRGLINTSSSATVEDTDFMPFWKAWTLLEENYDNNGQEALKNDKKVWGAIKGLAASYGDPHTSFFDPTETKEFTDVVSGKFGGVGMEVTTEGGVPTIVSPLKNSPAAKAGLLPHDMIIKVDGKDVTADTTEQVVRKIKGDVNTEVVLTLVRESEKDKGPFDVKITRAIIEVPVVETDEYQDVFIIKINSFSETAPELFRKALYQFSQSGKSRLVLDLRNNPGGYLEAAVSMTSWFLPEGKIIVQEKSGGREYTTHTSLGYNVFRDGFKVVVLINGGSASASEIMAGALRDQGKAVLVGEKTFGKGSVQKPINLTPDTLLKITIAHWFTPNGTSIDKNGIVPDIEVKQKSKYDPFAKGYDKDEQMKKAFEEVRKL